MGGQLTLPQCPTLLPPPRGQSEVMLPRNPVPVPPSRSPAVPSHLLRPLSDLGGNTRAAVLVLGAPCRCRHLLGSTVSSFLLFP